MDDGRFLHGTPVPFFDHFVASKVVPAGHGFARCACLAIQFSNLLSTAIITILISTKGYIMFNKRLKDENAALKREVKSLTRELEKANDSRTHLRKIIKAKDRVIYNLKSKK